MKIYFTKDYLDFFIELAANNHKEWFDLNRKRYIRDVKEPFERFVSDLMEELRKKEDIGDTEASDFIFRINRDIRFSKDKTPYKLQMSAAIAKGGKKDMVTPGLYTELGPEHLAIYTGMYMPDKPLLQQVRTAIAERMDEFNAIIHAKEFKKVFGEVKGERAKLMPPELKEKAKVQPIILNKQFYLVHTADPEIIISEDLIPYIINCYKAARTFNDFLKSVI
jgi:uncharacterized protein (TIGR02453 family)